MWDKAKCLCHQVIGITGMQEVYQVSFHIKDPQVVLATGNNIYKYYKIKDNGIQAQHQTMAKKDVKISTHYTCHAWMPDEKIIVCTDIGEIMLLESSGEFKTVLADSPGDDFYIESIVTHAKGFIIEIGRAHV